jgi:hypothetical protein
VGDIFRTHENPADGEITIGQSFSVENDLLREFKGDHPVGSGVRKPYTRPRIDGSPVNQNKVVADNYAVAASAMGEDPMKLRRINEYDITTPDTIKALEIQRTAEIMKSSQVTRHLMISPTILPMDAFLATTLVSRSHSPSSS